MAVRLGVSSSSVHDSTVSYDTYLSDTTSSSSND